MKKVVVVVDSKERTHVFLYIAGAYSNKNIMQQISKADSVKYLR